MLWDINCNSKQGHTAYLANQTDGDIQRAWRSEQEELLLQKMLPLPDNGVHLGQKVPFKTFPLQHRLKNNYYWKDNSNENPNTLLIPASRRPLTEGCKEWCLLLSKLKTYSKRLQMTLVVLTS